MVLGFKGFKPGLIATLGNGSYQYQPGEASKTKKRNAQTQASITVWIRLTA